MTSPSRFGAYFRKLRTDGGWGLRRFCAENGFDAGNISKLERGKAQVPKREVLTRCAQALGILEGSVGWIEFFDLAAAESGRIPDDILSEEQLAQNLPLVFRLLRGQQLNDLAELVRQA